MSERVEAFLVPTSWPVFPLTNAAFVVQVGIGKVQGCNIAYEE